MGIDIPMGGGVGREQPEVPDAPPAVGGGRGDGGREKYRREDFGRRERRSVSHEERVRLRERERRDWERRDRADSETDARLGGRFGGRR